VFDQLAHPLELESERLVVLAIDDDRRSRADQAQPDCGRYERPEPGDTNGRRRSGSGHSFTFQRVDVG